VLSLPWCSLAREQQPSPHLPPSDDTSHRPPVVTANPARRVRLFLTARHPLPATLSLPQPAPLLEALHGPSPPPFDDTASSGQGLGAPSKPQGLPGPLRWLLARLLEWGGGSARLLTLLASQLVRASA
jgi:hypothetical protein